MAERRRADRQQRVVGAIVVVAVALTLSLSEVTDQPATEYFDASLKRALATFAIARGVNGVISVIQGTEVAVTPAGVGLTLTPGQILDPLNDLIERFSWVMLLASSSLAVQRILLEVSAWGGMHWLLAAGGLFLILTAIPRERFWRRIAWQVFLLCLIARFAVPVTVLINQWLYQEFMADSYAESTLVIERTEDRLEQFEAQQRDRDETDISMLDSARDWLDRNARKLDLEQRMQVLKDQVADASDHLITLIAIFMLQTVLLPITFLWAVLFIGRRMGRGR